MNENTFHEYNQELMIEIEKDFAAFERNRCQPLSNQDIFGIGLIVQSFSRADLLFRSMFDAISDISGDIEWKSSGNSQTHQIPGMLKRKISSAQAFPLRDGILKDIKFFSDNMNTRHTICHEYMTDIKEEPFYLIRSKNAKESARRKKVQQGKNEFTYGIFPKHYISILVNHLHPLRAVGIPSGEYLERGVFDMTSIDEEKKSFYKEIFSKES